MTEPNEAEMTDVELDKAVELGNYELPKDQQPPCRPPFSKRTKTIWAFALLLLAIVGGVLMGVAANTENSTPGTSIQPGATGNGGESPTSDVPTTTDSPKDADLNFDTGTTDAEDPVAEDEAEDPVAEDEDTTDEDTTVVDPEEPEDEVTEDVVVEENLPEMSGTIYDLVLSTSGDKALEDTSSPTYLAFEWMSLEDTSYTTSILSNENELITRYSLAAAYYAFLDRTRRLEADGTDVSRHLNMLKSNWMSDIDHCEWHGIKCKNGCVTEMTLHKYGLTGSIPDELSQLTCLEVLNLGSNKLEGSIPDSFYTLSNLEKLYLNDNKLSGSISNDVGALTNLENMYLGENKLSGSIPDTVTNMKSLIYFSLLSNKITGEVPIFPTQIQYLDLGSNQLEGTLPEMFSNYRNLGVLYLDHNDFHGTIPDGYGTMGNKKLQTLYLNNNTLTGTLPLTFGGIWILSIRTEGNDITINDKTCKLLVLTGNGELLELGADCGKCDCEDLCDGDKCY